MNMIRGKFVTAIIAGAGLNTGVYYSLNKPRLILNADDDGYKLKFPNTAKELLKLDKELNQGQRQYTEEELEIIRILSTRLNLQFGCRTSYIDDPYPGSYYTMIYNNEKVIIWCNRDKEKCKIFIK